MNFDDLLKGYGDGDRMLSTKKTADLLDVKQQTLTVWRWLKKAGKPAPALPFVRVGRRTIKYRLSDIRQFIEQNRSADSGKVQP